MPSALHPQAKFDPIPPDLDLSALVEETANFDYVIRISTDQIRDLGLPEFEKLILLHVTIGGRPLVIEGWNKSLPPWLFSQTWLEDNVGKKQELVRDISNCTDIPMTIGHYLSSMEKLTKQWTPTNFRDSRRQRLYLKDIDCPEAWHHHLQNVMPQTLFYLNDCVGEKGGPGAVHRRNMYNQLVLGQGVSPAGDLMSNLPPEMRAENMMCYIGHEGTYTPAHREMCASLGQNIMVEASAADNGEKAGSSIWFMTESKDREVVSEYFLSVLGHDIEVESHFAQINAWKKAPFPVYIVEQKIGDFVLIPPLAPHQVWNRGTRTMKVAWNRTTIETLELALHEALPRARMVCRDEQYKNKAILYYSLLRYYDQLKRVEQAEDTNWEGHIRESVSNAVRVKQLKKDFKRLFALYTEILVSETFSPDLPKVENIEFLPFDSNVTCSYCRCNIFNRFLTCKSCVGEVEAGEVEDVGEEDAYDVCMECYTMGRSCGCISNLTWVEQWQWPVLNRRYEEWRAMVIAIDGIVHTDSSPQPLDVVRSQLGKKTVAQICQEQLKKRPWKDVSKLDAEDNTPADSEIEPDVDNEGRPRKRRLSKRAIANADATKKACHICKYRDWKWKLALCTTCSCAYCYGTLWRAFDLQPQTVMENPNWQCPRCLDICSCGSCRKIPSQQGYRPKGTLLGHDTKCVADPRSVESLVDFGRANLLWLRHEGDEHPRTSSRMQKLVEKAQTEKARNQTLDEELAEDEEAGLPEVSKAPGVDALYEMSIDPQLRDAEIPFHKAIQDVNISNQLESSHESLVPRSTRNSQSDKEPKSAELGVTDIACTDSQGHLDDSQEKPDSYQEFVDPADSMFVPESVCSDHPAHPAHMMDRMIGMGYYQQANDADKILFDHPDIDSPIGPEILVAYPRLLIEEPDYIQSNARKRKEESMSQMNVGDIDEAHVQFFQAQKKQKLTSAKKNGIYFMTQNQLDGGRSLMVKLPMARSKDFLRRLDALDQGQMRPRYNPRSRRTSVIHQEHQLELDGDDIIVRSDVQGTVAQSLLQKHNKELRDSITLATRAMGKLSKSSAAPRQAKEPESPKTKRGRGQPRKDKNETLGRKRPSGGKNIWNDESFTAYVPTRTSPKSRPHSPIMARMSERPKRIDIVSFVAHGQSPSSKSNIAQQDTNPLPNDKFNESRPHSPSPQKTPRLPSESEEVSLQPNKQTLDGVDQVEEHNDAMPRAEISDKCCSANLDNLDNYGTKSPPPFPLLTSNITGQPHSSALISSEIISTSERLSDEFLKRVPRAVQTAKTQEKLIVNSASSPSISSEEDEYWALVENEFRPISAKIPLKNKSSKGRPNVSVSEHSLAAKEEASRGAHLKTAREVTTSLADRTKTSSIPLQTKPQVITMKSHPKAPPGKLLSMAERQALRGKSFKIVAARSMPTRALADSSTTTPASKFSGMKKPSVHVRQSLTSNSVGSIADNPSSGSDDESIPAVRPAAKKPRLESLIHNNGKAEAIGKHMTGTFGRGEKQKSAYHRVK